MNSPAYFTENQNNFNPHDRISYEQSAAIVISHVRTDSNWPTNITCRKS